MDALDNQRAGTDQVGEFRPLIGIEQGVDLLEKAVDGVAEAGGAGDAALAGLGRFGGVERLAGQGVGKVGKRPAVIHFGLGALGLEFVQQPGQLGHLLVIQFQLVSQEPQRPSHSEAGAAETESFMTMGHKLTLPAEAFGPAESAISKT